MRGRDQTTTNPDRGHGLGPCGTFFWRKVLLYLEVYLLVSFIFLENNSGNVAFIIYILSSCINYFSRSLYKLLNNIKCGFKNETLELAIYIVIQ